MTFTLNQSFINDFQALGDTLDHPELQIAALLVDLAWNRLQADQDLRNRSIPPTPCAGCPHSTTAADSAQQGKG